MSATELEQIPLLDLTAQYRSIKNELDSVVMRVVESQGFILGPEVEAFEEQVAKYCNCKYSVGVSSGTDALLIALMALDIKAGDEVITTPYTFFATAGSIVRAGAKPVFVDIDPATFNIDVDRLEAAITPKTRAIMPVHLFGQAAPMKQIQEISSKHNLAIIEDAAQAIGSEYSGQRIGSFGDFGCFSFFPSKNLGAFGDAGLVTTNSEKALERLRQLRVHGGQRRYYHEEVGGNFRIDALQAAVLSVKLRYLDGWTAARRKNADLYRLEFERHRLTGQINLPLEVAGFYHIYNQFVVTTERRDELLAFLTTRKVGHAVYYPLPLHLQRCFHNLGYVEGDFPHSERAAKTSLALPIYPELKADQIRRVVDEIATFLRQ